jgi:hypothetical protein
MVPAAAPAAQCILDVARLLRTYDQGRTNPHRTQSALPRLHGSARRR